MLVKRFAVVAVIALLAASPAFGAAVTSISTVENNPTNASSVKFLVTFDTSISGGSASNFSLTTTGVSGASISGVTGSGFTRTVTVNSGSGTGTIKVNLANSTGMSPSVTAYSSGEVLNIDKTAPTVSSIVRMTPDNTKLDRVNWKVTFSEKMLGGATSNFSVYTTGISGASVTGIMGNGIVANAKATERYVTASTGTGNTGSIRLDLSSVTGLTDLAGNALAGTYSSGQAYAISRASKTGQTVTNQTFTSTQSFSGLDYVTVSNCTFQNFTGYGALVISNCGDVKILDCTFQNVGSSSGDYGIIAGFGNKNVDINGCDIINVTTDTAAIKFPIGGVVAGRRSCDVRINDLFIDGVNENGSAPYYASDGIRMFQVDLLRVTNSQISYCSNAGIGLALNQGGNLPTFPYTYRTYGVPDSDLNAVLIDSNYIHHTRGECISSQAFSWNTKIVNNELAYAAYDGYGARTCTAEDSGCGDHNTYWQGPGVHIVDNYYHHNMDGVDGTLLCMRTNGLVERNTFTDGNEAAISYFNDHDCDTSYLLDIRNNLMYNINGRGFSANAGNGSLYAYVTRVNLYHNTIVITPGARTPIQDHYSPVQFMNWASAGAVGFSGNIIDFEGQTSSNQYYAWVTSGASYWVIDRAQAQNIYTPFSVAETTVFNNKSTDDYHLKAGSPAIDGATLFNWVSVDTDNVARGSVDDIGAYEYSGTGPTLSSLSPSSGASAGGTSVTLTGTNLTGTTGVSFGGTAATGIVNMSATQVRCTSPAGSGTVSVTATTGSGTSNGVNYTYTVAAPTLSSIAPTSGTTSGGTACTLTGTDLTGCSAVSFGGTAGTGIVVDSATRVRCTSPAKVAGTYGVTATTPGGTSGSVNYTFTAPVPTLSSIAPTSGSTAGGTACTLTGTGLIGTTGVSFGGTAGTAITVDSATQVRCTSPAKTAGTISVTATTAGGTSGGVNYTYTAGGTYYTATLIASDATMTASAASGTNYNGYNNMQTLNDGGQNYYAILKFSLSSLSGTSVTSAKLRVNIMNAPASHDADLWQTTDSWAEGTVTWANQPAKGTLIQTLVVSGAGYKEFDCTSYVAGQFSGDKVVSFYITDNDADNVWVQWNTEEATNYEPKLVVITQ